MPLDDTSDVFQLKIKILYRNASVLFITVCYCQNELETTIVLHGCGHLFAVTLPALFYFRKIQHFRPKLAFSCTLSHCPWMLPLLSQQCNKNFCDIYINIIQLLKKKWLGGIDFLFFFITQQIVAACSLCFTRMRMWMDNGKEGEKDRHMRKMTIFLFIKQGKKVSARPVTETETH